MQPLLVIADDLTGAAEIGGIAVQRGLSADIVRGAGEASGIADLLVLDTDTRQCDEKSAHQRVRSGLKGLDPKRFGLIYKKTDSVLRGNVAAEIEAILDWGGIKRSILMPQNPSLGRTIRQGLYLVNGIPLDQTEFRNDPEHPRVTSLVHDLLGYDREAITIADGESRDDLLNAAGQLDSGTLPAGGADFFAAVLEARGIVPATNCSPPVAQAPHLFVCGSASRAARDVVGNSMAEKVMIGADTADPAIVERWAQSAIQAIRRTDRAILAVFDPIVPERASLVGKNLSQTVSRLLTQFRPATLWIEGGATASAILGQMGWDRLKVCGTIVPGVVMLLVQGEDAPLLVLKPGSYAWPIGAL